MSGMVDRKRTAITRASLSRPVRLALGHGLLRPTFSFFDYGCGHAQDVNHLKSIGFNASGWDPNHFTAGVKRDADVVNLGYVVNVIEDPVERAQVLLDSWQLCGRILIVSARLRFEQRPALAAAHSDGIVTRNNTFQKFYDQAELESWISNTLQVEPCAAAPGVFYVFRSDEERQEFVAKRFRREVRVPEPLNHTDRYRAYQALFDDLAEFFTWRGRLPVEWESAKYQDLISAAGSISKAFRTLEHVFGQEHWTRVRKLREEDLLVLLALSLFRKGNRMSIFDRSTQQDIRTLLGGYTKGIESGRALLFSAGRIDMVNSAMEVAKPGKLTASSFYVHRSGLNMLPPLLRVFEGCAHVLVGTVEGANVIKLRRREPRVSYLNYPKFDSEGHPALAASLLVDLRTFNASYREYCESPSPPILHRKELFVPATYPNRNSFVRLTAKEEALGLLNDDEEIGTRAGWLTAIESRGITIRGHRVYRLKRSDKRSDESTQN